MREILFRGKSTHSGKWVEGELYRSRLKSTIYIDYYDSFGNRISHCVIPDTVGQYTGITDNNDNKIFEGDILQFDYTGKNLGVAGVAAVAFENGKFGVKWGNYKEFVCLDGFANTTLEVIGNIYDNPELLKD